MNKVLYPILATIMALLLALSVWPAVAKAEVDDPFTYAPSAYSASVSPGGSTMVMVAIGITGGPALSYPVTCSGWNLGAVPSGWTVTANPVAPYAWANATSTVAVALTITVPSNATPGLYSFPVKLQPGKDSGSPQKTVGEGTGIHLNITVQQAIQYSLRGLPVLYQPRNSTVLIRWQYVDQYGNVTNSSALNPVVTMQRQGTTSPVVVTGLRYDSRTNAWQFNLLVRKTVTNLSYRVCITIAETGQCGPYFLHLIQGWLPEPPMW